MAPEEKTSEVQKVTNLLAKLGQLNPNPLVEVDFSGNVTFYNDAAVKILNKLGLQEVNSYVPKDLEDIVNTVRQGKETWFYREVRLGNRVFGEDLHGDESFQSVRIYGIDITALKKAEEARDELAAIVASTDDAIIGNTLDGKITTWNRGAERLYGYTSQEIMGQSIIIIVPSDRKDEVSEILQKISRGESLDQYEAVHRTKDRQQIHVCLTISPIKDAEGRIIGASTIARDITERKRADEALRKSEENFRSLFDHMIGGFAHCRMHFEQDRPVDFTYLNVNDAFETLTGLKNVTGKRVSECIPGIRKAHPEVFEIYGRVALTGKPERFETYIDPLKKWFSISVYSPQKEHFVAVFDDITLRKRAEVELCHRTVQLEKANREMETFSHSVFHDLKGPVRAIAGFSRMLMGEHADKLDAEGLRLLKVITDNTKLMHTQIDDLQALSRLGKMRIKKSAIDLSPMAKQVFNEIQAQAPERDLRLKVGDLPRALGDQALLRQVIMNLLANAIKFTKSRKPAVIEVGSKDGGNETIYYVKDNGAGFDERYAHKLFGVFQRLHGGQKFEGIGVGLATVKRIIERHGGRVWAEGRLNEGATFYFALPKKAA